MIYFWCVHAWFFNLAIYTYIKKTLYYILQFYREKILGIHSLALSNDCFQSHNLSPDASLRFFSDLASPGVAPSTGRALPSLLRCQKPHLSHLWSGIRNDTAHPPCLTMFIVFLANVYLQLRSGRKGVLVVFLIFLFTLLGLIWKNVLFLTGPRSSRLSHE